VNIGFRMITHIRRPEADQLEVLCGLRSCDISDVLNRACTMTGLRAAYPEVSPVIGPAVTVSIPIGGINMIKLGMQQTQPGDILVVSGQGDGTSAMWGGNLSRGLKARGVAALVIDGAVRDVSEIREAEFPVFSRGIATAAGPIDTVAGEINVPIACGGVVVNPGDIVIADEDGIVVIPPTAAHQVAAAARRLMEQHASAQPVLLRGEVTRIDEITDKFLAAGLAVVEDAS
jgi:regulator of RNase E activity RraA